LETGTPSAPLACIPQSVQNTHYTPEFARPTRCAGCPPLPARTTPYTAPRSSTGVCPTPAAQVCSRLESFRLTLRAARQTVGHQTARTVSLAQSFPPQPSQPLIAGISLRGFFPIPLDRYRLTWLPCKEQELCAPISANLTEGACLIEAFAQKKSSLLLNSPSPAAGSMSDRDCFRPGISQFGKSYSIWPSGHSLRLQGAGTPGPRALHPCLAATDHHFFVWLQRSVASHRLS
jgi:hypothetical protein